MITNEQAIYRDSSAAVDESRPRETTQSSLSAQDMWGYCATIGWPDSDNCTFSDEARTHFCARSHASIPLPATPAEDSSMTAELDWIDDAEVLLRQHYSQEVIVYTAANDLDMAMLDTSPLPPPEEFCIEYDVERDASIQELPRVATLAMAESMCRIHGVGADLLDVRTLALRHQLDTRGWLIPIAKEEAAPAA